MRQPRLDSPYVGRYDEHEISELIPVNYATAIRPALRN